MDIDYEMHGGSDFVSVGHKVRLRMRETGNREALVSIIFAPPRSVVLEDLAANFAYYDLHSGTEWDLFFAGYRGTWGRRLQIADDTCFGSMHFSGFANEVSSRHARALRNAVDVPPDRCAWKYSGKCDLVSLMTYAGEAYDLPEWDWLSLRFVSLTNSAGSYDKFSLGELVEVASRWRQEPPEMRMFAPGEPPMRVSVFSLTSALTAVAASVVSGVAGNVAYDLLKKIV